MKLTVLGSGTAIPHPRRSGSGYWLETKAGTILLDCAASVPHRIAQEKLDWANLDAIWISHFHLDHVGGLAPLLFGMRNATETKTRKKPLQIFGAKGLQKLIEAFDEANSYKLFKQPFPIEIIEVEPLEKFEILPEIAAVALDTPHTNESLALHLISADAETLVYTVDTGFTMTLGDFARGVDLLLIECSFHKNKPVEKHLELAEVMHLARYAKPKRAMLTHFYPEWDAFDLMKEAEKFSPLCQIIEAYDGLKICF